MNEFGRRKIKHIQQKPWIDKNDKQIRIANMNKSLINAKYVGLRPQGKMLKTTRPGKMHMSMHGI